MICLETSKSGAMIFMAPIFLHPEEILWDLLLEYIEFSAAEAGFPLLTVSGLLTEPTGLMNHILLSGSESFLNHSRFLPDVMALLCIFKGNEPGPQVGEWDG